MSPASSALVEKHTFRMFDMDLSDLFHVMAIISFGTMYDAYQGTWRCCFVSSNPSPEPYRRDPHHVKIDGVSGGIALLPHTASSPSHAPHSERTEP